MTEQPKNPRAKLYQKIAVVTAAVSRIPKNGENSFHGYKYATESDITDGLRELLMQNGLAFLPPSVLEWQRDETVDNPKVGPRTRVKMQFELADTDTGEVYTSQMWGEGQDTGDKGFYKAYTGAVKYFLMKTFLIATGDDPEQDHRQPAQPASSTPQRIQQDPKPATNGHTPAPGAASEKQIKMLFAIWHKGGFEGTLQDWVADGYKCKVDELTKAQASEAIETLQPKEQPQEPRKGVVERARLPDDLGESLL